MLGPCVRIPDENEDSWGPAPDTLRISTRPRDLCFNQSPKTFNYTVKWQNYCFYSWANKACV